MSKGTVTIDLEYFNRLQKLEDAQRKCKVIYFYKYGRLEEAFTEKEFSNELYEMNKEIGAGLTKINDEFIELKLKNEWNEKQHAAISSMSILQFILYKLYKWRKK